MPPRENYCRKRIIFFPHVRAQQESQSLSQNVKIGLQYRYQHGEVQVNCNRFLGYTHGENNKLVIIPEKAEVVKRIYLEYLEGASMLKISRGLMKNISAMRFCGKRSIVWRCVSRLENTGLFCDARAVLESTLEEILVKAINTTLKSRDSFLTTLQNNIATVLSRKSDAAIDEIEKKIEDMQIQLLKLASAHADIKQVTDEIYRLRDDKQKALVENAGRDDLANGSMK